MQMRLSKSAMLICWRKISMWFLALSWLVGMLLGMISAFTAGEPLISLMRESVKCSVSIPGLLTATVLPFLLSAFAVLICEPWLLLVISAFKAFSFGFCACGVSLAFGQSSWLVRFLLLFSDLCLIPPMYLYWIQHINGQREHHRWELCGFLCFAVLVAWLDTSFVAPFLVSIIES